MSTPQRDPGGPPPYPIAPARDFPTNRKFVSVEFPGFVVNVDKALNTFGGEDSLNKVLSGQTRFMELRFRPKDPYCHPVFGDQQLTSGLLIRVSVPKKQFNPSSSSSTSSSSSSSTSTSTSLSSSTSSPSPSSSSSSSSSSSRPQATAEVVGIIETSVRFKGMADFQYVPGLQPPKKKQPDASFSATSSEQEMDRDAELAEKETEQLHLPPPIFSRADMPLDYAFRGNPAFRVETELVDGVPVKRYVYTNSLPNVQVSVVDWKNPVVPTHSQQPFQPKSEAEKQTFERLKQLFEERPVWSLVALKAKGSLTIDAVKQLKKTLPHLAYFFEGGPWRKFWVRMGYDPRTDPESRIYQIIDFRIALPKSDLREEKAPKRLKRPRVDLGESESVKVPNAAAHVDYDYTFTEPPKNSQPRYQLCDIEEPNVQALLKKTKPTDTCDVTCGWFPPGFLRKVRSLMKARLRVMWGEVNAEALQYLLSDDEDEKGKEKGGKGEEEGGGKEGERGGKEGEKGKGGEEEELPGEAAANAAAGAAVDEEDRGYLQTLMENIGGADEPPDEEDPFGAYTIFEEDAEEGGDDKDDSDDNAEQKDKTKKRKDSTLPEGIEMEDDEEEEFFK